MAIKIISSFSPRVGFKGLHEFNCLDMENKISKYDLRLGNMFEQGIVYKISGRDGAEVHLHGKGSFLSMFRKTCKVERLKPILLTPEVLVEWCGFEKQEDCWNFEGFKLWDSGGGKFYHINSELLINIDYLHELQNLLYAISKEELEIKG